MPKTWFQCTINYYVLKNGDEKIVKEVYAITGNDYGDAEKKIKQLLLGRMKHPFVDPMSHLKAEHIYVKSVRDDLPDEFYFVTIKTSEGTKVTHLVNAGHSVMALDRVKQFYKSSGDDWKHFSHTITNIKGAYDEGNEPLCTDFFERQDRYKADGRIEAHFNQIPIPGMEPGEPAPAPDPNAVTAIVSRGTVEVEGEDMENGSEHTRKDKLVPILELGAGGVSNSDDSQDFFQYMDQPADDPKE